MSNTEIVNETADIDDIELHEVYVYIADDNEFAHADNAVAHG